MVHTTNCRILLFSGLLLAGSFAACGGQPPAGGVAGVDEALGGADDDFDDDVDDVADTDAFDPNGRKHRCGKRHRPIETLTVPTDGTFVSSARNYAAGKKFRIKVSGRIVWGGCDPVSCPDGASCNFSRLGDAQFHSDNCFTGPDPTFTAFNFPIQLFLDGAALPATPFSPSHVYKIDAVGNGGAFVFNYNDIPGTYGDNSGSFKVRIFSK